MLRPCFLNHFSRLHVASRRSTSLHAAGLQTLLYTSLLRNLPEIDFLRMSLTKSLFSASPNAPTDPDEVSKRLPNAVYVKVLELRSPKQPHRPIQTFSRGSKTTPKRPQDSPKIILQLCVGCPGCRPWRPKELNVGLRPSNTVLRRKPSKPSLTS